MNELITEHLKLGSKIKVFLTIGKEIEGEIISLTDSSIKLRWDISKESSL